MSWRRVVFFLTIITVVVAGTIDGTTVQAEILGLFIEGASTKHVATIDESTGALTDKASSNALGGFSTGVAVLSRTGATIYTVANGVGEADRHIVSLDAFDGTTTGSVVLFTSGPHKTAPGFLFERSGVLHGLFTETDTVKQLGTIDPSTGVITFVFSPMVVYRYQEGVAAYDVVNDLVYFTDFNPIAGERRILQVAMSTGTLSAAVISTYPAGYEALPVCLDVDAAGTLHGILKHTTDDSMVLVSIDAATGTATQIGSAFAAGRYSGGVSAIDVFDGYLYFTANSAGGSARCLYKIEMATGAVVSSPVISSASGFRTEPIFLIYRNPYAGLPGRIPNFIVPGTPLSVTKNTSLANHLDFSWGASCNPGVTDYAISVGNLTTLYNHDHDVCTTGGATSATREYTGTNIYFIIVPLTATMEGSYGVNSSNVERPVAATPCHATQSTEICP